MSINCVLFFFNDTATTEIYTLSLHDALPIFALPAAMPQGTGRETTGENLPEGRGQSDGELIQRVDRKSTRLNSSHGYISYAVFCLKKKKNDCDRVARSARPAWFRHA